MMNDWIDVQVREVGMRDGLQSVFRVHAYGAEEDLVLEGIRGWCARNRSLLVRPGEIVAAVPRRSGGCRAWPNFGWAHRGPALIPNLKGAERGICAAACTEHK